MFRAGVSAVATLVAAACVGGEPESGATPEEHDVVAAERASSFVRKGPVDREEINLECGRTITLENEDRNILAGRGALQKNSLTKARTMFENLACARRGERGAGCELQFKKLAGDSGLRSVELPSAIRMTFCDGEGEYFASNIRVMTHESYNKYYKNYHCK